MIWAILLFVAPMVLFTLILSFSSASKSDKVCGSIVGILVIALFWGMLFFGGIIPTTTGLCPDYGQTEIERYIAEASWSGVYWKTGEISVFVGENKSFEKIKVSTPYKSLYKDAHRLIGKKVRIKADQWLIGAKRNGNSPRIIQSIEQIE